MTAMPPPCQHCGRARLSTGLCPHCEHIQCRFCFAYMPIVEFADHMIASPTHRPWRERRDGYLFWWEIATTYPVKCPDCGAILNRDRTCPNDPNVQHPVRYAVFSWRSDPPVLPDKE